MNRSVDLESALRRWLDAEAPAAPPDDLLSTVLARTAGVRQRPPWLPRLELPLIPAVPFRMAWLVVLILLLVAAMAGALIVGQSPSPPASVENGLIAFIGEEAGGWDLYLVEPDGSAVTRLTDTTALEWGPVWSPDGTRLAFVREVEPGGPPPTDVDCEADPAACERGTPGEYAIVAIDPATGAERVLFQSPGTINFLTWSPDGAHLAFDNERAGGLFVLDVATGGAQVVFGGTVGNLVWAPDSTRLLISSGPTDEPFADLYLVYFDGREATRLTHGEGYGGSPSWSPDGSRIAFSFDPDGSARASRIEVMAADGNGRSVLVDQAYGPAWSPDGSLIAFVKTYGDPTGESRELWIMTPDGTDQRKLADFGSAPRWSPDGTLIYFGSDDGVWAVGDDGSGLRRLAATEIWISGLGFHWQPVQR